VAGFVLFWMGLGCDSLWVCGLDMFALGVWLVFLYVLCMCRLVFWVDVFLIIDLGLIGV